MTNPKLVISGSIAIDRIMNFSGHYRDMINAAKVEVLSVSVLVQSLDESEGGTGGNIASNLAYIGEKPILLGSIGKNAEPYISRLKSLGVDTSHIHISKLPTATFNNLTDSQGNQVGGFYPGAMTDSASLSFSKFKGQDILACISAHDPVGMRRQIDECKKYNIRLIFDPGQQVTNNTAEDLLAGVKTAEVLIVNEYELSLLSKKIKWSTNKLKSQIPIVITTHGEHGSVIGGSKVNTPINIKPVKPKNITDPTGAGDAYRTGFLYGYLRKWDLKTCGQLGSVIASFALEQHGPQAQLSTKLVSKRYKKSFNKELTF